MFISLREQARNQNVLQGGPQNERYKWGEVYNPYKWPKINE